MVPLFFFFLNGIIFSYTADVNRPQATAKTIVDAEECEEVRKLCHSLSEKDDLLVLECLLSTSPEHLISIKQDCQNVIWEHTKNLIQFDNVKRYLTPSCRSDLTKLPCSEDYRDDYLKCVVNNFEFIQNPDCKHALGRLQNAAFTDHLWSPEFIKECQEDITSLKCGFIDPHSFSQARTLTCLQNNIFKVKDSCKREISHLSQLQSLNIKLDAQLYVDCSDDQQRYCHQLVTGSGRVFPCLMRQLHMDQSRISTKCRQHLRRREKLIAQDFRISKGLIRACRDDIKNSHCRQKTSSEKTVRLAQILLCLEDRMRNGTKVSSECESEIMEHRRMLMDDYRLSPEIVNSCKNETATFCHGFEVGGRTIHCLMNHALNRGSISRQFNLGDGCLRAIICRVGCVLDRTQIVCLKNFTSFPIRIVSEVPQG